MAPVKSGSRKSGSANSGSNKPKLNKSRSNMSRVSKPGLSNREPVMSCGTRATRSSARLKKKPVNINGQDTMNNSSGPYQLKYKKLDINEPSSLHKQKLQDRRGPSQVAPIDVDNPLRGLQGYYVNDCKWADAMRITEEQWTAVQKLGEEMIKEEEQKNNSGFLSRHLGTTSSQEKLSEYAVQLRAWTENEILFHTYMMEEEVVSMWFKKVVKQARKLVKEDARKLQRKAMMLSPNNEHDYGDEDVNEDDNGDYINDDDNGDDNNDDDDHNNGDNDDDNNEDGEEEDDDKETGATDTTEQNMLDIGSQEDTEMTGGELQGSKNSKTAILSGLFTSLFRRYPLVMESIAT